MREADLSCSDFIFESRNDDFAVAMSPGGSFSIIEHKKWFARALARRDILFFVASLDRQDIGVVRFEWNLKSESIKGVYITSINLHKNYRGRKLAPHVLALGIESLQGREPTAKILVAHIRKENLSSLATFTKCGFTPVPTSMSSATEAASGVIELRLTLASQVQELQTHM